MYNGYHLDIDVLNKTYVFIGKLGPNEKYEYESEPRSLSNAARYFWDRKLIKANNCIFSIDIECENGEKYVVSQFKTPFGSSSPGDNPNTIGFWIFYIMCLLMMKGNGPAAIIESSLYLFDTSYNLRHPATRFAFFAVNNDEIIIEELCINLRSGGWIDGILKTYQSEETWGGENEYAQARIYWLYNKFYTKTKVGQILKIKRFLSTANPDLTKILYD